MTLYILVRPFIKARKKVKEKIYWSKAYKSSVKQFLTLLTGPQSYRWQVPSYIHTINRLENFCLCKWSLGFPRDGTSCCPFVPGQKYSLVPLSRDKGRSKNPGTNSSVPGRPGTKWIKKFQKKDQISCFRTSFSCFRTSFPVLEHHFLF